MTDALRPILDNLRYHDVQFDYFTAPAESVRLADGRVIKGIASINSGEESACSSLHCWPSLKLQVARYDAFLVACYSAHPLVGMLKKEIKKIEEANSKRIPGSKPTRKYVTGIFEASVLMSLSLISGFFLGDELSKAQATDTFGIVSTGSVWEKELSHAVQDMLVNVAGGQEGSTTRFAGVATTGLTAGELHTTPPEEVRKRISDATEKLIKDSSYTLNAVCMGCAGMAGMDEAVREGCVRAYGEKAGNGVRIVDGVVAGVGMLVAACKAGF